MPMELLDIRTDLYQFDKLITKLIAGDSEFSDEQVCGKLLYHITKYRNSPQVVQMLCDAILEYKEAFFALMLQYAPELFMEKLLETSAAKGIYNKGLDGVFERPFGKLNAFDKVYLLYLEFYCNALLKGSRQTDKCVGNLEKVNRTLANIRQAEEIYAKHIPTKELLLGFIRGLNFAGFRLKVADGAHVVSGYGRITLTVIDKTDKNRATLEDMRIEYKEIQDGLAYLSKIGVCSSLSVDLNPDNERYMGKNKIPYNVSDASLIISSTETNMLMRLTYRDLISLWPSVNTTVVQKYMLKGMDERVFMYEKCFCEAVDDQMSFIPLSDPVGT